MRAKPAPDLQQLCLSCGLCCNGVIFARGELRSAAEAARAKSLGLALIPPRAGSNTFKFAQPCSALRGCECSVYGSRPQYCREFECLLFSRVRAGQVDSASAAAIVRRAVRRAACIERLLGQLGDNNAALPLMSRFRRVQRRMEQGAPDRDTALRFAKLSLEVHRLTLLLSREFYSG